LPKAIGVAESGMGVSVGVIEGVLDGMAVKVGVRVCVILGVAVVVGFGVRDGVTLGVRVADGVCVDVFAIGVFVILCVGVAELAGRVAVGAGTLVLVAVGACVAGIGVDEAIIPAIPMPSVSMRVGASVLVATGACVVASLERICATWVSVGCDDGSLIRDNNTPNTPIPTTKKVMPATHSILERGVGLVFNLLGIGDKSRVLVPLTKSEALSGCFHPPCA
jgi:hypothetical protein